MTQAGPPAPIAAPPWCARNEAEARAVAARAFDVKTGFAPGQGVLFPPWSRAALVRAEHVDDPRFEAEGPAALLEPSF